MLQCLEQYLCITIRGEDAACPVIVVLMDLCWLLSLQTH